MRCLTFSLKEIRILKKKEHLIESSKETLEKQKEDSTELRRLLSEKYQIQKKIDILLQKIYTE